MMIEIINMNTDEALTVTYLPGLKKPCLCIRKGYAIKKYATLQSDDDGVELMGFIADMFHLERMNVPYEERLK